MVAKYKMQVKLILRNYTPQQVWVFTLLEKPGLSWHLRDCVTSGAMFHVVGMLQCSHIGAGWETSQLMQSQCVRSSLVRVRSWLCSWWIQTVIWWNDDISKLSKTTATSSAAVCASVTTLSITGQRGKDHSKNNFTMCYLCTFQELVWGLLTAELGMTVNISYIYLQAPPSRHAVSVQAHLLLHVLSVPMVWDAQGYLGSPTHLGNADKYYLLYHNLGSPVFRSP